MVLDLHQYISEVEEKLAHEVIHVEEPISIDQQMTALVIKLEQQRKYPVLVFDKPLLANGSISALPVVTNVLASRRRCAEAIGAPYDQVAQYYCAKMSSEGMDPIVVRKEEAPVKEVVETGAAIDLTQLPVPIHHRLDPGPYLTAGFLTTYDPDTGIENTALHRAWVLNQNTLRCMMSLYTHDRKNYEKYKKLKKEMRIAYWIGHHPAVCIGAQSRLSYPESHYRAVSSLTGFPLRLVPSETLGDDFLVPADAEVVIEGILDTSALYPEGPFGEYTGYTGPQVPSPQVKVTAVTRRRKAYWYDLMVGHADNLVMGGLPIEGAVYEAVKKRIPSLSKVYVPLSGTCRFHAYLQLVNPSEGDSREAILAALPVDMRLKHVFVFDEDIDIFDDREVLFAIATRTQWDKDVLIIPRLRGSILDPSMTGDITTKGGIDCTKPVNEGFEERNQVDADVLASVKLDNLLGNRLDALPQENM